MLRLVSAAVLAPLALGAIWAGSPYFPLLVMAAAGVMGWEWARLTLGTRLSPVAVAMIGIEFAAAALAWWAHWIAVAVVLVGGATAVAAVLLRSRKAGVAGWTSLGLIWIGLASVAAIWLRAVPDFGRSTLIWIMALVWATDSMAFFVGRAVGGPRLAPRISAGKTWSGALGGVLGAAIVGGMTGRLNGQLLISPVLWVTLGLSIVAQAGDLLESAAKRHFGVKDSSALIPGHGGVLDRLDAMLAVLWAAAVLTLIGHASPLDWH